MEFQVKVYRVPFTLDNVLNLSYDGNFYISEYNQDKEGAIQGVIENVSVVNGKYVLKKGLDTIGSEAWYNIPKTIVNKDFIRAYNSTDKEHSSYFEIISTNLELTESQLQKRTDLYFENANFFVNINSNARFGNDIRRKVFIMDSKSRYLLTTVKDIYGTRNNQHLIREFKVLRKDNISKDVTDYKDGLVIGSLEYNFVIGFNGKGFNDIDVFTTGIYNVVIEKQIKDSEEIIQKEQEKIERLKERLIDNQ